MIISFKHSFIFMHSRKTAGSSLALYLSKHLGPQDLQLGPYADMISNNMPFNRRFYKDLFSFSGVRSMLSILPQRFIEKGKLDKKDICEAHKYIYSQKTSVNPVHMLATEAKSMFSHEWDSYFKFCFVRNPYEKAVSDYKWRLSKSKNKQISFYEFLQRMHNSRLADDDLIVPKPINNWDIYTINDQIVMDFIGRYENLDEDFSMICKKIDIPFDPKLMPWAKKVDASSKNYQSYYDQDTRKLVEIIFANEIDQFKYTF